MLIPFQDTLQDSWQPEEYRILAFRLEQPEEYRILAFRLDSQTVCGLEQLFNVLCVFFFFPWVKKFVRLYLFIYFLILLKQHIHFECLLSNKWYTKYPRSSVQSLSHVRLFVTPWTAALQASRSVTNSWSLFKLMSIKSMMLSTHLILWHPLLLLPSIFPSIRVFSSESILHIMWPKYWSFSFSISSSNEYSGLISFRMDWLDILAVQGTLKNLLNLLQHHSSKA